MLCRTTVMSCPNWAAVVFWVTQRLTSLKKSAVFFLKNTQKNSSIHELGNTSCLVSIGQTRNLHDSIKNPLFELRTQEAKLHGISEQGMWVFSDACLVHAARTCRTLSCVVISLSLGRNKKECFMEKLSVDGRKVVQADVGNSVDVEMQVLLFTC